MSDFGKRLKELRTECHLKQSDLAAFVCVQPSYISRLETGSSSPSDALIEALARCTGCSYHWLKYGEGSRLDEDSKDIYPDVGYSPTYKKSTFIEEKHQFLPPKSNVFKKNRLSPREVLVAALIDYFYRFALPVPVEIPSHDAQNCSNCFPFAFPDFSLDIRAGGISKWAFYTYASQIQKPAGTNLWPAEQTLFQMVGKLSTQLMQPDVKYSFVIDDDRFLHRIEKYRFDNLNATVSVIILHPFADNAPIEKYLAFHRSADIYFLKTSLQL